MNKIDILNEYLKSTDLSVKELCDRNCLSQIVQAMDAWLYENQNKDE